MQTLRCFLASNTDSSDFGSNSGRHFVAVASRVAPTDIMRALKE